MSRVSKPLRIVARRIREVADVMPDQLQQGVVWAVKPLDRAVRREIHRVMPHGYAPTLDRSYTTRTYTAGPFRVRVVGAARGAAEERDLIALDDGRLRHPLFGLREWWYRQPVRPHFFTRPALDTKPQIEQRLKRVTDNLAKKIEKG